MPRECCERVSCKRAKILAKVSAFGVVVASCFKKIVYNKQKNNLSRTTYRNRLSLRGTPKPLPLYQFQRGWGEPPQILSINFNPMGGALLLIESIFSGGCRTLSFDISILSRGQINSQTEEVGVGRSGWAVFQNGKNFPKKLMLGSLVLKHTNIKAYNI